MKAEIWIYKSFYFVSKSLFVALDLNFILRSSCAWVFMKANVLEQVEIENLSPLKKVSHKICWKRFNIGRRFTLIGTFDRN